MVRSLVVLVLVGCHPTDPFDCVTSVQCRLGTSTGTCEPTGFCSFTDATCASGRRYDPTASAELAGACVPVVDSDHDGVADGVDNCPTTFNPTQDNEDGDAYGDVCDPCPPFAETMPPSDSDNDGVTDLCDLHLDPVKRDRIVMFEGMHHGMPTSWSTTGTWTDFADSSHFISPATFTFPIPPSSGLLYVFVGVTFGTIAGDARAGVALAGMQCTLEQVGAVTLTLRTAAGVLVASTPATLVASRPYTIVEWWDGAQLHGCDVVDSIGVPVTISGTHAAGTPNVGFDASGQLAGDVAYVMIVAQ